MVPRVRISLFSICLHPAQNKCRDGVKKRQKTDEKSKIVSIQEKSKTVRESQKIQKITVKEILEIEMYFSIKCT